LLAELSRRAGPLAGLPSVTILQALQAREKLGSTGLGRGFALPHARIDGLENMFGLFARLDAPIDFQAVDEKPVDLVFLLLIPAAAGNEHVTALAAISRRLRNPVVVANLRQTKAAAALYDLLAVDG
jgi:PTS system nitrogen regulatory IIA component